MKLKMKLAAVSVATSLIFSPVVNASGIPVVDGAQIAQSAANFIKEIAEMQTQLQQMKQQYAAITGSRNMGDILTDTGLKSALPEDWQKVYTSIQNGGYKGLDGTAKALADAAKLMDKCNHYQADSNQQKTCQTATLQSAQTQSDLIKAMDNATSRLENLKQLASKINSATDIKAIEDLNARISIEQAAIQNEQTRLQLFMKLSELQEKHAKQQEHHARFEARQKANCAALSEKVRSTKSRCQKYQF